MYGLKQAGLLANQLLQTRLAPFGYYPVRHTPELWMHKTWPISFTFAVDDFAVKYVGQQYVEHLRNDLLRTYELATDCAATVYLLNSRSPNRARAHTHRHARAL
jgi:hypothetical protein